MLNHANNKHNKINNTHTCNQAKGMYIELPNDIAIRMAIDYGRIEIIHRPENCRKTVRRIICLHCAYGNTTQVEA